MKYKGLSSGEGERKKKEKKMYPTQQMCEMIKFMSRVVAAVVVVGVTTTTTVINIITD
jgi:hypothetical protein